MNRTALGILGMGAAVVAGRRQRDEDAAARAAWYTKNGLTPPSDLRAPVDRFSDWIGDKFKSATSPAPTVASDADKATSAASPTSNQYNVPPSGIPADATGQQVDMSAVDALNEETRKQSEEGLNAQSEGDKEAQPMSYEEAWNDTPERAAPVNDMPEDLPV